MDDLKDLKRTRGGLKARTTYFKNYVQGLVDKLKRNANANLSNVELSMLNDKIVRFEALMVDFDRVQTAIESVVADEEVSEQYAERENFERAYDEILAVSRDIINAHYSSNVKNERANVDVQSVSSGNSNVSQAVHAHGDLKLPTIQLPSFTGNNDTWLEFRDTYTSLIHENASISNIQKFHYLRASLKGEAADILKVLEFSAETYSLAWEAVCNRYNNTRLLVNNHLKAFIELESISKESADGLRNICSTTSKHLRSLEQLGLPVSQWSAMVVYMITRKLDGVTIRAWEEHRRDIEFPTFDELNAFLQSRAELLETIEPNKSKIKVNKPHGGNSTRGFLVKSIDRCENCKEEQHAIIGCEKFKALSVEQRIKVVKDAGLCLNCLRRGHFVRQCRAQPCMKCKSRHNTLLHIEKEKAVSKPSEVKEEEKPSKLLSSTCQVNSQVLLATARVAMLDVENKEHIVRALLDSGSQSSFISSKLCERLGLVVTKVNMTITGLNNASVSQTKAKCQTVIKSLNGSYSTKISCYLLDEITDEVPSVRIDRSEIQIPENLVLADPLFDEPASVDLLIGAELFWSLIGTGQIKLKKLGPIMQETKLGWIITGPLEMVNKGVGKIRCNLSTVDIQEQLRRFWEIEECSTEQRLSQEELACETKFKETTKRDSIGRFIVNIPLKLPVEVLGKSREQAENRFIALERRLSKNPELKSRYVEFMNEYRNLGHMNKVNEDKQDKDVYYAPHHGVLKEESETTKLRVVFDCSAKTSSGYSFNDIQMIGPTIQNDLLSIILRFRKYDYVVSGDIAKMYRQVLVTPDQRSLQRIIWRADTTEPLESFDLCTVTYGTASAPFLAIRCLHELGIECENENSAVARIIKEDFYVDDVLTGGDDLAELIDNCKELDKKLKAGCFELRKWRSNSKELLRQIGSDEPKEVLKFGEQVSKTLGLAWLASEDELKYTVEVDNAVEPITKRKILSRVSKIFDPLGLLGPCVMLAKIILQKLWCQNIEWDDEVPIELQTEWSTFEQELSLLNGIRIPRGVKCIGGSKLEIHGFADASEKAYGACVYIKTSNVEGTCVSLLCAKSKVAPLKSITLPRLELCAAVVLVRLIAKVVQALQIEYDSCVLWSDSTVVLSWIKLLPNQLKQFVANRVAEIQSLKYLHEWRHVRSADNPADLISRGANPRRLIDNSLWWKGPKWLMLPKEDWPESIMKTDSVPDIKKGICTKGLIAKDNTEGFKFDTFSKWNKLIRTMAYVLRFINNCRVPKGERNLEPLKLAEINTAKLRVLKLAHKEMFGIEINALQREGRVSNKSKLIKLNPFLDEDGLVRVGGRLKNGPFDFEKTHPIVMDAKHHVTKLLVRNEHLRLLHAGPQALLASIREKYWPIGGRNLARAIVAKCIECFRVNPKPVFPIMGNLPSRRLSLTYPFSTTGTDFAGPVFVRERRGRGARLIKAYICIFICFATKAIHVELVSDLSSKNFIMALRRFVARRGKPLRIYSDNGTNYVGANAHLSKIIKFLKQNESDLKDEAVKLEIEWVFIPPHSPHFGGLWEAGVKRVKYHLNRVLKDTKLTFEEYDTLLTQIESVVNSRPLVPLSSDPSDFTVLTPAHFLLGRPAGRVIDENYTDVPVNRLDTYQYLQLLKRHFWERWNKEYVAELQQRHKWKTPNGALKEGILVLLREDNLPPLRWKLGRIVELHTGSDGVARVATIKTEAGTLCRRAFSKLCPLPEQNEEVEAGALQGGRHVGESDEKTRWQQ